MSTVDPMLVAIMTFVEEMCQTATASATGYYNAGVINIQINEAKAKFVKEMTKLESNE